MVPSKKFTVIIFLGILTLGSISTVLRKYTENAARPKPLNKNEHSAQHKAVIKLK